MVSLLTLLIMAPNAQLQTYISLLDLNIGVPPTGKEGYVCIDWCDSDSGHQEPLYHHVILRAKVWCTVDRAKKVLLLLKLNSK